MKKITVRNIEEKDIPRVVDVHIAGWKSAYKGIVEDEVLDSLNRAEQIERRMRDYKDSGFIVAEADGKIAGFCRYTGSSAFSREVPDADCELLSIYVAPELKRNGIGTALFRFVADEFKSMGKTKMIVWCLKDNVPSKKFYAKMGGKIVSERTVEIAGKTYRAVGFLCVIK